MTEVLRVLLHHETTSGMRTALGNRFPEVEILECNSYNGLPEIIAEKRPDVVYSVRFAGTRDYPAGALLSPKGPRWIANGGVGTDHLGTWDTTRTTVTNAAGVAAEMMAEYILGGFLHFTLDVPGLQKDKANKRWADRTVRPVKGKTLLIVGLGHTGRALASRAKALGMTVIGTRARPVPTDHVDEVHASTDLANLLPRADFVAVATPLIPETRGLLNRYTIGLLKPGVVFADVSRGGVVDQSALADALTSGHVAGAVLDVFEIEPLPHTSPLWEIENMIISPHCSSVYDGWAEVSFELFLKNLENWVAGRPLFNVVDPVRGY